MEQVSEVIEEIQTRMDKLDRVDEIVAAVQQMIAHVNPKPKGPPNV